MTPDKKILTNKNKQTTIIISEITSSAVSEAIKDIGTLLHLNRELNQPRRQRQRKLLLKVNNWEMVTIL